MRCFAGLALLLLADAKPVPVRAPDADAADRSPIPDLMVRGAEPGLTEVSAQTGRPSTAAACIGEAFLVPGDAVLGTGANGDDAGATDAGLPPAPTTGWLPPPAAVAPSAAVFADGKGPSDWRPGPEQCIGISHMPDDDITLDGEARFGARGPDRVQRGGVNTGDVVTVARAGRHLAFLLGAGGKPLADDGNTSRTRSCAGGACGGSAPI